MNRFNTSQFRVLQISWNKFSKPGRTLYERARPFFYVPIRRHWITTRAEYGMEVNVLRNTNSTCPRDSAFQDFGVDDAQAGGGGVHRTLRNSIWLQCTLGTSPWESASRSASSGFVNINQSAVKVMVKLYIMAHHTGWSRWERWSTGKYSDDRFWLSQLRYYYFTLSRFRLDQWPVP